MLNQYLMQCSREFRLFIYATAGVIGLHAVLPKESFDGLAAIWSFLTVAVAVVGTVRHSFWKGQGIAALAYIIVSLFDFAYLSQMFLIFFIFGGMLSFVAMSCAQYFRKKATPQAVASKPDDAVVSVVAGGGNTDATAAEVLNRFGLNRQNAQ
jgi:hypothetical protein